VSDSEQSHPIAGDPATEKRLAAAMREVLLQHDAPSEVLKRFDLIRL
jgi:hypothetical protein